MDPERGSLETKSWSHEALGCRCLILKLVALCPDSLSHPQVPGTRCTLWLREFCPFPWSWEAEMSPQRKKQLCPGPEFKSHCLYGDRALWLWLY